VLFHSGGCGSVLDYYSRRLDASSYSQPGDFSDEDNFGQGFPGLNLPLEHCYMREEAGRGDARSRPQLLFSPNSCCHTSSPINGGELGQSSRLPGGLLLEAMANYSRFSIWSAARGLRIWMLHWQAFETRLSRNKTASRGVPAGPVDFWRTAARQFRSQKSGTKPLSTRRAPGFYTCFTGAWVTRDSKASGCGCLERYVHKADQQ